MSRVFDATSATDYIGFSPGNASSVLQGPITMGVLAKTNALNGFTGWMITGKTSGGTRVWSLLTSNNAGNKLFVENDFGAGASGMSTSWRWYVATRGSGLPRFHIWDLSGTWTHVDGTFNPGSGSGAIANIFLGVDTGNSWRGKIAAAAVSDTNMSDAQVEAKFTLNAVDLTSMKWATILNQTSTSTAATDITGGGGDQASISGTTVDTGDDPPGYNYSLSFGPKMYVWNGTSEVLGTVYVYNGTTEVPATAIEIAP